MNYEMLACRNTHALSCGSSDFHPVIPTACMLHPYQELSHTWILAPPVGFEPTGVVSSQMLSRQRAYAHLRTTALLPTKRSRRVFVTRLVCWLLTITVGANQTKIVFEIIGSIAINMIKNKFKFLIIPTAFNSTYCTSSILRLENIITNTISKSSGNTASSFSSFLPMTNCFALTSLNKMPVAIWALMIPSQLPSANNTIIQNTYHL